MPVDGIFLCKPLAFLCEQIRCPKPKLLLFNSAALCHSNRGVDFLLQSHLMSNWFYKRAATIHS